MATKRQTYVKLCFINPCINLFVPPSTTGEHDPKILELTDLFQCIPSCHLKRALLWLMEGRNTSVFSVLNFHSLLVTHNRKPI